MVIGSQKSSASLTSRFDKAIRLAEKKARFEGREDLVDTWKVPEERLGFFPGRKTHAAASAEVFFFSCLKLRGEKVEMLCFQWNQKNTIIRKVGKVCMWRLGSARISNEKGMV